MFVLSLFWLFMTCSILACDTSSMILMALIFETDETYGNFSQRIGSITAPRSCYEFFRCASSVLLMTHKSPPTGQATNINNRTRLDEHNLQQYLALRARNAPSCFDGPR